MSPSLLCTPGLLSRLRSLAVPTTRVWSTLLLCAPLLLLPRPNAAVAAGVAGSPAWTLVADHSRLQPPPSVQYGMVANPQGTIFVYGGNGNTGAQSDFWSWDPRTGNWTQLNSAGLPALIEPHLAADAQGAIYEFGGITGAATTPITATTGMPITGTTTLSATTHVTADGYSYGLYRYDPASGAWQDLTPPRIRPGLNWPPGREDFGFTYDPGSGSLWVFAGDGTGAVNLDDLWRYNLQTRRWTRIGQRYHDPGGVAIDPREIYNISDDDRGGFYLFGGSYLAAPGRTVPWTYVNDLWYYTIATDTWTLIGGRANAYDPSLPVPRHYYAQATDAAGNFYILGGYVSATTSPPYFADDAFSLYANLAVFPASGLPSADVTYALADFWRFNRAGRAWADLTADLGALNGDGFIPYVMVDDPAVGGFCTFGGFHPDHNGILAASSNLWCIREPGDG